MHVGIFYLEHVEVIWGHALQAPQPEPGAYGPLVQYYMQLFIFLNMGHCGSENVKTLLLPQLKIVFQKIVLQTPDGGPHKMFFLEFWTWSLIKAIKNLSFTLYSMEKSNLNISLKIT